MVTAAPNLPESKQITLVDNTNPLRQFRSYSYHFFLVACESTQVLDYLSSESSTNAFERAGKNLQNPRDVINVPNFGNYVIVLDTRQDTDIIIDDVQWGTTFIGDQNSTGSSVPLNVVMTDGIINFMEPRGVNFLNILAKLGDQLGVDMICMPFCLKTIFYGHTDGGQVIPLPTAQPLGFIPVDITGSIDERGTNYRMDICGVVNGIAHNPAFSTIVDNVSFSVVEGAPLARHLQNYTEVLNRTYQTQRAQILKNLTGDVDLSAVADIKYNITLEPNSQVLQKLTDFGTNITDQVVVEDRKHIIKGTKEGGIVEVINKLMTSSQEWVKVAAQGDPPDALTIDNTNKRYTFKVTQEFTSTSSSISKSLITINIIISEYRYDTVEVVTSPAGQTTVQPPPTINPNNVIIFDYIFTGKNIDILGMEINLSMGLQLLQQLATSKSMYSQGIDALGVQVSQPSIVTCASPAAGPWNIHGRLRKGTPIFAPVQWTPDYLKEMKDIQNTAAADAIWKDFAGAQSLNTTINIHGNPLLLAKVINPDRSVPNYAKINIKMPNTIDDIWEYQLGGNQHPGGYYKNFWFTGYYLILSAVNKFQGGLFTQELVLISLPQTSSIQGSTAASDAAVSNVTTAREQILGQTAATIASTSNTSAIPTAPITSQSTATTLGRLATPTTNNPISSTHEQFVANYWNTALAASQITGLNPDFALAQSAVETGWGTEPRTLAYSTFFNQRSFNSPYQSGIIAGTNTEAGNKVKPFASYSDATNSFLDQHGTLTRIYPISANATDINTYANGLANGKGGLKWAPFDPNYVSNIIGAYNNIQMFKSNLGIQSNTPFAGGPVPVTPTTESNFLPEIIVTAAVPTPTPTTASVYATNRTVAAAAIAQKAPVFTATG